MRTTSGLLVVLAVLLGAAYFFLWRDAGVAAPVQPARPGAGAPEAAQPADLQGRQPATDLGAPASNRQSVEASPAVTPPAEKTAERVRLTGRLLNVSGDPAGDAIIRFTEKDPAIGPGRSLPSVEGRAGSDGRFELRVRRGAAGRLELPGRKLVFSAPAAIARDVVAVDEDRDLGDLKVGPASRLAGLVRDDGGRPQPAVQVRLAASGGLDLGFGDSRRRAETDARGHFELTGLCGGDFELRTASGKFLPQSMALTLSEGEERDDVVLVLHAGGAIAGVVVDDQRRPVEKAHVGINRERHNGNVTVEGLSTAEAVRTDAAGRFEIGGLDRNQVAVEAWAPGHKRARRAGVRNGTRDVVLVLPRNGSLRGTLVDGGGAPIAGSGVEVRPVESPIGLVSRSTETDGEGRFAFADVPAGRVSVVARGAGHVAARAEVEVQPGAETSGVRLVAARGATLEVLAVDAEGAPVGGATVRVEEPLVESVTKEGKRTVRREVRRTEDENGKIVMSSDPEVLGDARTGADGKAVLSGLRAGRVVVVASHDELAPSLPVPLDLPAAGKIEATVALRPAGAAVVRVVDADGAPVRGAKLAVDGPLGAGQAARPWRGATGEGGEVRIGRLPVGSYAAVLEQPPRPVEIGGGAAFVKMGEQSRYESTRTPFTVVAGQDAEVELTQPVLTTVRGTLHDASGPVAAGSVAIQPEGAPEGPFAGGHRTTTDESGAFSVEGMPPGRYVLRYGRKGQAVRAEQPLELRGQREVEQNLLLTGGTVRVTVQDSEGESLHRAKVTLRRARASGGAPVRRMRMIAIVTRDDGESSGPQSMRFEGGPRPVYTGADGVAEIADVPPGRYEVEIEHAQHIREQRQVEVAAGAVRDAGTVRLRAAGLISVKVVDSTGASPGVALVRLQAAGSEEPRVEPAMQGVHRFTGLAPGRYELSARMGGPGEERWGPRETVEVEAGRSVSKTLVLPRE